MNIIPVLLAPPHRCQVNWIKSAESVAMEACLEGEIGQEAHPLYMTSSISMPSCFTLSLKVPILAFTARSRGSGYLMMSSGRSQVKSVTVYSTINDE